MKRLTANLEAEAAVLGDILLSPHKMNDATRALIPEDFTSLTYRTIFEAMLNLHKKKTCIEPLALHDALAAFRSPREGGYANAQEAISQVELLRLEDATATGELLPHHIQRVAEASARRRIRESSKEAHRLALYDPNGLQRIAAGNGHFSLSEIAREADGVLSSFPRPRLIGQLLAEVGEPPPMLIERILPKKRLILCTGKPKLGKTFVSLEIVCSVAAGEPVFGGLQVDEPGRVLWLQMEDGEYEIADRLRKRGLIEHNSLPIYAITERIDLSSARAMDYLINLYKEISPVMVVIDTARESLNIRKWDDPTEVSDRLRPIRDFAHTYCSVLLVAHNRKAEGEGGDEIAGSNAFAASVDGWMSGWKGQVMPNGNRRMFFRIEGRGNMHGELVLEMNTHTLKIREVFPEELEAERLRARDEKIPDDYLNALHIMAQNGGKGYTMLLAEKLKWDGNEDTKSKRALRLLKVLAGKNWIEETDELTGGTGRVKVYRLTQAGKQVIGQSDKEQGEMSDLSDCGLSNNNNQTSPSLMEMSDCPITYLPDEDPYVGEDGAEQ